MNQHNERREFYRIEDQVTLAYQPCDLPDDPSSLEQLQNQLPKEFETLNAIRQLDHENTQLLRTIQDKSRDVAHYLKVQNQKFDILTRYLIEQLQDNYQPLNVNISGNGVKFTSIESLNEGSLWQLTLMIYPVCYAILCLGKVAKCEPQGKQFEIAMEFAQIKESDQDELVKHITRLQSIQLRKERLDD